MSSLQVVLTRLPRIPRSSRSSGVWSRKVSPAGLEYLKMDDEVSREHGRLKQLVLNFVDRGQLVP